jgi:hypothetical protein
MCPRPISSQQRWDWLNGDDPAMVQRVTSKVLAMEKRATWRSSNAPRVGKQVSHGLTRIFTDPESQIADQGHELFATDRHRCSQIQKPEISVHRCFIRVHLWRTSLPLGYRDWLTQHHLQR